MFANGVFLSSFCAVQLISAKKHSVSNFNFIIKIGILEQTFWKWPGKKQLWQPNLQTLWIGFLLWIRIENLQSKAYTNNFTNCSLIRVKHLTDFLEYGLVPMWANCMRVLFISRLCIHNIFQHVWLVVLWVKQKQPKPLNIYDDNSYLQPPKD